MITGKKDAKVIREVINRLRAGPYISFHGFAPLLGLPIQVQVQIEAETRYQVQLWASTWIAQELNNLLPYTEKVKL